MIEVNRPLITVAIVLATLMQTLDSTIANVALPHMQGALSASQGEITWVLTSYIVAAAIAMPLTSWLAGRFGVSQLLCAAISGFTVASVFCGISTNLPEMVGARLLQGVFGAVLVPLSQTILLSINPKEKYGHAMALWGMGVMLGPIIGPTLGGWLTENYNWRWVFFVNVPIGIFALFGVLASLPKGKPLPSINFDFLGFTTLAVAIGALQLLLDRGEQLDWMDSTEIRIEAIVAAISFLIFSIHITTCGNDAFFKTELLRDRNFRIGMMLVFLSGAILFATRALLPPMLQNLMGYNALSAGLVMAPSGIGAMLAMLLVGRLIGRCDTRILLVVGLLAAAFASYQMTRYTLEIAKGDIAWPGVIQGFGLGFVFVPLSVISFSTLRSEMRADGSAIYSLARTIGGSIGISLGQSIMSRNTQIAHASLIEHINISNLAISDQLNPKSPVSFALLNSVVTQQASMIAYLDLFKLMFVITVCLIPLVIVLKTSSTESSSETVHLAIE